MTISAYNLWTERQFQQSVKELARAHRWTVYHTFDSRRSDPGFPDLCLVRDGRLVFLELKSQKGKLTPEQGDWLSDLASVPGVIALMVKPADMPYIRELLT